MGIVMPTENSDAGTWDETLNAAGERIDEHDHTTGKGLPITPDAISINKDLAMGGNSLTGIDSLDFNTLSGAIGSRVRTLYWSGGDLYARNASGQTIRITNGGALDLSLVGGIGGDYTTTDAEVEYDFTNDRYKFLSDASPETYSKVTAAVAQLINGVYAMNVVAPTLAANRTITLPQYAPSGQRLLQIDSSGVITPDNAVDEALTLNGAVTASDLTVTSGDMKHGERTKWIAAGGHVWLDPGSMSAAGDSTGTVVVTGATGLCRFSFCVELEEGQRIKAVKAKTYRVTASGDLVRLGVFISDKGSTVSNDNSGYIDGAGPAWFLQTYTLPTPRVIGADDTAVIYVDMDPSTTGTKLEAVAVVYDRV